MRKASGLKARIPVAQSRRHIEFETDLYLCRDGNGRFASHSRLVHSARILGVAQAPENQTVLSPGSGGSGADKIAIEQESLQGRHKLPGGRGFYDVTLSAGEERIAHDLRGGVLREEKYPSFGRQFQDLLRYLNPTDVWEPDIEHHYIRFKLHHFLDGR